MPFQLQITVSNSDPVSSPFPNRIPTNQPYGPRRPTRNAGRRGQAEISAKTQWNSAYKICIRWRTRRRLNILCSRLAATLCLPDLPQVRRRVNADMVGENRLYSNEAEPHLPFPADPAPRLPFASGLAKGFYPYGIWNRMVFVLYDRRRGGGF